MLRKTVSDIAPYSPGASLEELKEQYNLTSLIKLASNENPIGHGLPDNVDLGIDTLSIYPDEARAPIVEMIAEQFSVFVNQVTMGRGSNEIIQLLGLAYLNSGDEVLSSEVTFSSYEFVAKLMGASFKSVPLQGHKIDHKALINAVSERTKLLFIANPNNPTGSFLTHEEIVSVLNKVPSSVIVVLDEAYAEYATDKTYPNSQQLLKEHANLIVLRTFSKIYGLAALRIGYAVSNSLIIGHLNKVKQPFNVSRVALNAAAIIFQNHEHYSASIRMNEAGKKILYNAFEERGVIYEKTQGNFIYFELENAQAMQLKLLRKGVVIRSLASFSKPQALRITIGTETQNKIFLKMLDTIVRKG